MGWKFNPLKLNPLPLLISAIFSFGTLVFTAGFLSIGSIFVSSTLDNIQLCMACMALFGIISVLIVYYFYRMWAAKRGGEFTPIFVALMLTVTCFVFIMFDFNSSDQARSASVLEVIFGFLLMIQVISSYGRHGYSNAERLVFLDDSTSA